MSDAGPTCPSCSRPMRMVRTLAKIEGQPGDHVFECSFCHVSFLTEDCLPIAGVRVH